VGAGANVEIEAETVLVMGTITDEDTAVEAVGTLIDAETVEVMGGREDEITPVG